LKKSVEQAGGVIVGTLIQRRGVSRTRKPGGVACLNSPMHARTWIGKGKVIELAELSRTTHTNVIIFCNILSDSQKAIWKKSLAFPYSHMLKRKSITPPALF
jgi:hypothetical protein